MTTTRTPPSVNWGEMADLRKRLVEAALVLLAAGALPL